MSGRCRERRKKEKEKGKRLKIPEKNSEIQRVMLNNKSAFRVV